MLLPSPQDPTDDTSDGQLESERRLFVSKEFRKDRRRPALIFRKTFMAFYVAWLFALTVNLPAKRKMVAPEEIRVWQLPLC